MKNRASMKSLIYHEMSNMINLNRTAKVRDTIDFYLEAGARSVEWGALL